MNEEVIWNGEPHTLAESSFFSAILAIVTLGIWWLILFIKKKLANVKYELTVKRINIRKGLFSTTENQVDLMRVNDIAVEQSFLGKIFNFGRITLYATDVTHPQLQMAGISNPSQVKQIILDAVEKRQDNKVVRMQSM